MWGSTKHLTRGLFTCCLMLLFACFSKVFNQRRCDCYQRSSIRLLLHLIRLNVATSVLGPISGKAHKLVFVPFVRTSPNKFLLAPNLSCHNCNSSDFHSLSRVFLCMSLWYDNLQQGSCEELLFLIQAKFLYLNPNNLPLS